MWGFVWGLGLKLQLLVLLQLVRLSSPQYTGYPGFWFLGQEYPTPHVGPPNVVQAINDSVQPCRYDGQICVESIDVLSEPEKEEHNTGRTVCVNRVTVPSCDSRMRLYRQSIKSSYADRLDALRPIKVYPETDGHTSTTYVSGSNFYGELGIGTRDAHRTPFLHRYWKLGDSRYEQQISAGRGFKNLTLVQFGFEHGFGLDGQGYFYAWGSNQFGQLGLQTRDFPDGHRYHALWPEPVPFFRPNHYYICEGGLNNLLDCNGANDVDSCFGLDSTCMPGQNQVAFRRNAFAASKQPLKTAHSAVVTEMMPLGCFKYEIFLDDKSLQDPAVQCVTGGRLWVWGYNMNAELGQGATEPTYIQLPTEVLEDGEKWYSVATGGHHTVATTISGKVYAWGSNDMGQLGLGLLYMERNCNGPDQVGVCCKGMCLRPQLVTGQCTTADNCLTGRRIVHVATGHSFTALLDSEGRVWMFGENKFGQLCQGRRVRYFGDPPVSNFDNQYFPARANLPEDVYIADFVAGFYHVVAVSFRGEVFAWGRNDRGQLGRSHLQDDSCHLEVKTELDTPLDVACGSAPFNGSAPYPRLKLCDVIPGNSTLIAAGELHSGIITKANHTRRREDAGYRYDYRPNDNPKFYDPTDMELDCEGPYQEDCTRQGKLFRWPSTLSVIYMWGDNRYGQCGFPVSQSYSSTPVPLHQLTSYDWFAVFAGARQSFWVSRVNDCPGSCNGHGICNHDTGRCTCEYPWTYEQDCLTAWCPNNCTSRGMCYPLQDPGDTGLQQPLRGKGPECECTYPFWDIDCTRAQCPNNCWGPDHGICNNTDGTCICVGNATVTYTGFDCYVPDPLHVLDPLRFYTQQLLRISPFFVNGPQENLTIEQQALLDKLARYSTGRRLSRIDSLGWHITMTMTTMMVLWQRT